jgi:predicted metal-dependent phosphoesterase TrpH
MSGIDLHTHTDESDGTDAPSELVERAVKAGLDALAITDHDTFGGYEKATPFAEAAGLRLICGIEITTKHFAQTIHLLGYFLVSPPSEGFQTWLGGLQAARRERNTELIARLRELGVDIHLEEVERQGRSLTGRPHFARVLVAKGYAANRDEAFDRYLGESGQAFVDRQAPDLSEAIEQLRDSGGLASLAHPIRLGKRDRNAEAGYIGELTSLGLMAIEAYHSDHSAADIERYLALAERHGLGVTGGSDFHGSNKPGARLGHVLSGTLLIPSSLVPALEARLR